MTNFLCVCLQTASLLRLSLSLWWQNLSVFYTICEILMRITRVCILYPPFIPHFALMSMGKGEDVLFDSAHSFAQHARETSLWLFHLSFSPLGSVEVRARKHAKHVGLFSSSFPFSYISNDALWQWRGVVHRETHDLMEMFSSVCLLGRDDGYGGPVSMIV